MIEGPPNGRHRPSRVRSAVRLACPHHRPQIEVEGEFLVEPLDYPLGDQPLGPHIRGRGNEHAQCSSLACRHRLVPSCGRTEYNWSLFAMSVSLKVGFGVLKEFG